MGGRPKGFTNSGTDEATSCMRDMDLHDLGNNNADSGGSRHASTSSSGSGSSSRSGTSTVHDRIPNGGEHVHTNEKRRLSSESDNGDNRDVEMVDA
jgi:hypothetical protein